MMKASAVQRTLAAMAKNGACASQNVFSRETIGRAADGGGIKQHLDDAFRFTIGMSDIDLWTWWTSIVLASAPPTGVAESKKSLSFAHAKQLMRESGCGGGYCVQ